MEFAIESANLLVLGYTHQIKEIEKREKDKRMIVHLSETPTTDSGAVSCFMFYGKITKNPAGLYESQYVDKQDKTQWALGTLFAPVNARKSFPRFEALDFKAIFTVRVLPDAS